jgi:hypothetical protein
MRTPRRNCAKPFRLGPSTEPVTRNRQVRSLPKIDGKTGAGRIAKAVHDKSIEHYARKPNIIQRGDH